MILQNFLLKTFSLNYLYINQKTQFVIVPNENLDLEALVQNNEFPYFLAKNCSLFNLANQNYKLPYLF